MQSKTNGRSSVAEKPEPAATKAAPEAARRWSGRSTPLDSRRDEILRSVGDVLRHSRLSSLSMVDIAARLGITKGNLYYYFNDKQDILFQCHMRCMDLSMEALESLNETDSAPVRLEQLLKAHIQGLVDGGLAGVLLADLEHLSAEQRKIYVGRRDEFESMVRRLIEDGVAEGSFDCDDSKLASMTMLGAINWIPKWYRDDGRLSAQAIAEGMTKLLLGGIRSGACK